MQLATDSVLEFEIGVQLNQFPQNLTRPDSRQGILLLW